MARECRPTLPYHPHSAVQGSVGLRRPLHRRWRRYPNYCRPPHRRRYFHHRWPLQTTNHRTPRLATSRWLHRWHPTSPHSACPPKLPHRWTRQPMAYPRNAKYRRSIHHRRSCLPSFRPSRTDYRRNSSGKSRWNRTIHSTNRRKRRSRTNPRASSCPKTKIATKIADCWRSPPSGMPRLHRPAPSGSQGGAVDSGDRAYASELHQSLSGNKPQGTSPDAGKPGQNGESHDSRREMRNCATACMNAA